MQIAHHRGCASRKRAAFYNLFAQCVVSINAYRTSSERLLNYKCYLRICFLCVCVTTFAYSFHRRLCIVAMLEQPIASYDSNTFTYICTQRRTASAATTTTTTPIVLILVILMLMSINSSAAMKKTAATVTTTNTSVFDSGVWLRIFHATRDMIFNYINSVERTATIVQQQYQPEIKTEFPCDTRLLVSRTVPTSVHRLRPGRSPLLRIICKNQRNIFHQRAKHNLQTGHQRMSEQFRMKDSNMFLFN